MQVHSILQKKCGRLLDSKVLEVIEDKVLSLEYNPGKLRVMKDNILKRAKTWRLLRKVKKDRVIHI